MNDLTLLIIAIIAALLQALVLFLLSQIFKELKELRQTFKEYVTHTTCMAHREANSILVKSLQSRIKQLEQKIEFLTSAKAE